MNAVQNNNRFSPLMWSAYIYKHLSYFQALQGGNMKHGHNEMVRFGIMRKIDEKRVFAIWRIDAPWKPQTKKGNLWDFSVKIGPFGPELIWHFNI